MIYEKINLKNHFSQLENNPILTAYCADAYQEYCPNKIRECVIILPGGAYAFLSEREKEPVALRLLGYDIAVFTLEYTVAPKLRYPNPFVEVYSALAYIRKNSEKYHIDKNRIIIMGFSAGGHLAASVAAYHQSQEFADYLNINIEDMKVNGCVLSYPVITLNPEFTHFNSAKNITQGNEELVSKLSVEKQINPNFPKTFIWHTTFDTDVSIKNSLLLAEALSDNNVFFEMHIYPMHGHGQSLADSSVFNDKMIDKNSLQEMQYNTQWVKQAINFIKNYVK